MVLWSILVLLFVFGRMVFLSILVLLLVSGDTVSADISLCSRARFSISLYCTVVCFSSTRIAWLVVFFLAVPFILYGHVTRRWSFADLCLPVCFYGNFFSGPFLVWVVLVSLCLSSLQKLVVGALYPSAHDNTSAFWKFFVLPMVKKPLPR